MTLHDRGFTLLEMLVALVVFGLVMAGLAQTFRFGLTAWSSETRVASGPEDFTAVDAALRRLIEQARPEDFTGEPSALAFTTLLPRSAGNGDRLADVAVVLTPGGQLLLRLVPHPAGIPLTPLPAPQVETLFSDVSAVKLSYLAPVVAGPPGWSDHWTGNGLPLLVRIHINFTNGRIWPDLVAAPINGGTADSLTNSFNGGS
jgi:general secretion pathway protein J